jgi:hypothetical protein
MRATAELGAASLSVSAALRVTAPVSSALGQSVRASILARLGCPPALSDCLLFASRFACQCSPALVPSCDAISGTYGELRDACGRDQDCGANGQCVARTPSQPRRCFCQAGWRGPLCATRSALALDPQVRQAPHQRIPREGPRKGHAGGVPQSRTNTKLMTRWFQSRLCCPHTLV